MCLCGVFLRWGALASVCRIPILTGVVLFAFIFFFKQKTAYELRISDWSSDVCSSDLGVEQRLVGPTGDAARRGVDPARRPILLLRGVLVEKIGRASCRERVCQYV